MTDDALSAKDRLVLKLLRMIVRLIGGAQKVKEYDAMHERFNAMSREEVDATMRNHMEHYLGKRKGDAEAHHASHGTNGTTKQP